VFASPTTPSTARRLPDPQPRDPPAPDPEPATQLSLTLG
jgi:hypothetical protein